MTPNEHSTQGGGLPVLEAGYYLATQAGFEPFIAELRASGAWRYFIDDEGDPRTLGYALTALPISVRLPADQPKPNKYDYDEGYNAALADVREALAKAGIGCGP